MYGASALTAALASCSDNYCKFFIKKWQTAVLVCRDFPPCLAVFSH
ncbi:hypothetical protein HMPREF0198_1265 [Cardiobacterium hominis ATCC 15826]|uniref:Uncharacterized protein n=1 Tax=Cardiobacterium hominis (strain ATCC 15826 / DSM 8339 / NCTC 10426 / 6573) TaxID=638300 RepID=C8N9T7_CARH6|nr:hypothetical protein HMPREF0198_1265 [Cardiobacterium hominis ATCC 15826]